MTPTCGIYLLAAGEGRRAGGPKAWLQVDGEPLLSKHVSFLTTRARWRVVVAVQSGWPERCAALVNPAAAITWVAVDPTRPPMASLLALLAAVPLDTWSFVYHVDMPIWEPEPFDRLAAEIPRAGNADAIMPVFRGRGGHPVLLSPRVAPALSTLDPDVDRLDHWLRGRTVVRVDVDTPTVHENWNIIP